MVPKPHACLCPGAGGCSELVFKLDSPVGSTNGVSPSRSSASWEGQKQEVAADQSSGSGRRLWGRSRACVAFLVPGRTSALISSFTFTLMSETGTVGFSFWLFKIQNLGCVVSFLRAKRKEKW